MRISSEGNGSLVLLKKAETKYQTQFPDKKLFQTKLHEFYLQNAPEDVRDTSQDG